MQNTFWLDKLTMSRTKTNLLEREGVNAVEAIFIKQLKWLFREQTVSDFGVDAQCEVVSAEGEPTGKLIALQIKSGTSFFSKERDGGYLFRGELRHLDYWERHSLPVFLVLHNPDTNLVVWQKIERRICNVTDKGWSVVVPKNNVLNKKAANSLANGLADDDEAKLRFAFSLDASLMEKFRDQTVKMVWEDWVNKGIGSEIRRSIFRMVRS